MGPDAWLTDQLDQLERIEFELNEQDSLIREQVNRLPDTAVPSSQRALIWKLFREVQDSCEGYSLPSVDSDNPDDLRPEIRSARARIVWEIKRIRKRLGLSEPMSSDINLRDQTAAVTASPQGDPRRVFVVHGRNEQARKAIFDFLSRINLDPIEWEEAIAFTASAAPSNLTTVEQAFAKARAAVIILTGDDLARLGKYYLGPHDEAHEMNLTPQARPNVLFEAGMAFGRFPTRTLIVSFGKTRPFTDIAGLNILSLSDTPESRQKIATRLRNAGCAVTTDNKSDWLSSGDFASAFRDPDLILGSNHFRLRVLNRRATFQADATYPQKVWIQIRNDGNECPEIMHSRWKQGPDGIRARIVHTTLQIKLGGDWYPKEKGVDRLKLPPGETLQTWIVADAACSAEDLRDRCQQEGRIGQLILFASGIEVELII